MTIANGIAAFFDLDGTLFPWPSLEWRFVSYLLTRGELGGANVLRWFWRCAKDLLARHAPAASNKSYLSGLRESLASEWAASEAAPTLPLLQRRFNQLDWHIEQGHRVVLVSGTLAPLARAVARQVSGPVHVIATELEVKNGKWTGRLASEHLSGPQKARAILQFAAEHHLQLDQSYAYGDRMSDLAMLESVGHPVAVNPSRRLERIARSRGWPICDWLAAPNQVTDVCTRIFLKEAR